MCRAHQVVEDGSWEADFRTVGEAVDTQGHLQVPHRGPTNHGFWNSRIHDKILGFAGFGAYGFTATGKISREPPRKRPEA